MKPVAERSRNELWQIVDPSFADPRERAVAEAVLTMVSSDWTNLPEIDVANPAVASVLRRHRVATLVPTEAVPPGARSRFREQLHTTYVTQMRIQAAAIEVCAALTDADIEHRVLKGLASAFLDYPRPELRQTGDVDLAVRPERLDDVGRVLVALGATRKSGSRNGELLKGVTWRLRNGVEVDVHVRLFVRTWEQVSVLDEPGEPVPAVASIALRPELRLMHAAGHLLAGSPVGTRRMSGLLDIVRLLDTCPDVAPIRLMAIEHGVDGFVSDALRIVHGLIGIEPDIGLANWPGLDRFDSRITLSSRRRWGLEYVGRLRNVRPDRRLAYLPTWLTPRRTAMDKAWTDISMRARQRVRR